MPLVVLEGNIITKPGWYDFTRQDSAKTVDPNDPSIFTYDWEDGGRYIYADYYADGIVTTDDTNPDNYISELVDGVETLYEAVTVNGEKQKQKWDVVLDVARDSDGNMILPTDITSRRIIGLEINFMITLGDKDPTIGRVVDPFGTGVKSGASFFSSDYTSDNLYNQPPVNPKLVMKKSQKAVSKSLIAVTQDRVLNPGFKAVEIDQEVLDLNQKAVDINARILDDDEIAISRDLLVTDELLTNDIDLTDLRLVEQDAVILSDDQIAISRDLLVADELFTNDID